ncbi:MAG TPA: hypothetical protein VEQ36_02520, partial [Thermomicrobiales bacterium]|nr:hypothetical protein [Thermomicrobiales bacterium]
MTRQRLSASAVGQCDGRDSCEVPVPGVGHPPYPERAPTSGRSVLGMILGVLGLAALYLSWRIPAGAG